MPRTKAQALDNRAPAAGKVIRKSMADQIFQALMEEILRGDLKPGDRLKELIVARRFNTSQAPVREALCRLEESGLVESECYRGARVRALRAEELREAYEVRALLDAHAGDLAAQQLKNNTEQLRQFAEAARKAATRKDFSAYAAADLPFHRAIVEAAGNSVLLRLWDSLHFEVRTLEFLCRKSLDLRGFAQDHLRIVAALERGDGRSAARLLRSHSLSVAALVETNSPLSASA